MLQALRPATLFQSHPKETSTQVIPMKIAKFLQIDFLWNTYGGCFFQFDKVK